MAETGFRKWIITITVIIAALLELIDTTIVNVSLPQIQGNLGATLEDVAWVVTGYSVANVIVLPMSGWLGSRFGRKNYFLTSIIVFTAVSFLCGNAGSLNELVVFRIIQGFAGGGLISTGQAILIETWPREGTPADASSERISRKESAAARALGVFTGTSATIAPVAS